MTDLSATVEAIIEKYGLRPFRRGAQAGRFRALEVVGTRRTRAELAAVAKAADAGDTEALAETLHALHKPAIEALTAQDIARHRLLRRSEIEPDLAARTRQAIAELPPVPSPAGGAPRGTAPLAVAALALEIVEKERGPEHTWKPGETHGLPAVIAALFARLGIAADPRAALAAVIARRDR